MKIWDLCYKRWNHLHVRVRFLVCITLAISLITSNMVFLAFTSVQNRDILTDIYFIKDLIQASLLPIVSALSLNQLENMPDILEDIYLSCANLQYIVISDRLDHILYCIPEDFLELNGSTHSFFSPSLYEYGNRLFASASINYAIFQNKLIVEMITPVTSTDQKILTLEVGLLCNANILFIISLIEKIIIAVFVAIWLTALFTLTFNFFIVGASVSKVSLGIQDIASGNFAKRINVSTADDPENLIFRFNQMAERLEYYERKNVEQLTLEKLKLETLVSIMADGAILLDKELRIIFINQSASKTFKFLKSCITGTYIFYYLPPYVNEKLLPVLNQMIEAHSENQSNVNTRQLCINWKSDVSKTFKFIIATVLDPDNQFLTGIGIIIQDITDQTGLDEAKTQFISNVSHELRTPLFNIRSFLETLSEYRDSLTEKQQIEFLEIANQETQRLTYLVNDVLDLSRLESDFLDAIELVELYDIIPPVVQSSQLRANEKNVELSYQVCPELNTVSGYANLLIQVASNLIGNSLKFTSIDGRITVKIYCMCSYGYSNLHNTRKIRIEVIDEGKGIREFDQSRIFDRFIRLENNVHTLEGTGLGLSIVKNIIDKHNSQIYLYSELGSGSSFWFDLSVREKKNKN